MTSDLDPNAQITRSRMIVVASPKGGVGKSTVATNLAILLAKQAPLQTVLVDLDLQFGDVAGQLDLQPDHTISDAVGGLSDTMLFKTFLTAHSSGLLVLAGVDSPVAGGRISDEQAADVLKLLASEFPVVIVDTGSGLVDHTLAALELATDVVLVTNMGVSSIKSLRRELDLLAMLDLTFTRHVVLNFCDRISGLTVEVAEGVVGRPIDVVLPRVEDGPLAANLGIPIVLRKKPGVMGKGLSELASRLGLGAPESPVEAETGRWRSRLGSQREFPPAEQTADPEQAPGPERAPEPEQSFGRMSWRERESKRGRGEERPAQEERTEEELAPYVLADGGTGQIAKACDEQVEEETGNGEPTEEESAEVQWDELEQDEVDKEQDEDKQDEDKQDEEESAEEESAEEESAEEESAEEEPVDEEPVDEEPDEEEPDVEEPDVEESDEEDPVEEDPVEEESAEEEQAAGEQGGRRKRWARKGSRLTGVEEQVQGEASQNEPGGRRKRGDGKRRRVRAEREQAEREPSPEVQVKEEQEETSPEKRS